MVQKDDLIHTIYQVLFARKISVYQSLAYAQLCRQASNLALETKSSKILDCPDKISCSRTAGERRRLCLLAFDGGWLTPLEESFVGIALAMRAVPNITL